MDLPGFFLIITSLIQLFLFFLVIFRIKSGETKNSFLFLLLSSILWTSGNTIFRYLSFQSSANIIGTLLYISAGLIPAAFVYFSYNFPKSVSINLWGRILLWLLPTVILISIILPNTLIKEVIVNRFNNRVVLDSFYNLIFSFYLISFFAWGLIRLLISRKMANQEEKRQILLVFSGIAVVVLFGVVFDIILPIAGNTGLIWIGPFAISFWLFLTFYAIQKYRLFDLRLLATEGLTIIMAFLLTGDILLTEGWKKIFVKSIILLLVIYGGYRLTQSVKLEIRRRRRIQKLLKELKHANKRLKELDATKTEFVSIASHELLTPISAIEGYLSMILDEKIVDIKDARALKFLNRVYQSSRRLAKLVTDLLNISRIEEGRLAINKEELDMSKIVAEVASELKFKARAQKIDLITKASQLEKAYADSDKIKEVLINLCGNSLKFTPPGGRVIIKTAIWPTRKVKKHCPQAEKLIGDRQLVVKVKDTGIGIAKKDLGKLFKKFSRLKPRITHSQGTGLGLYISQSLVKMLHGIIWAESKGRNQGSTFFFSLPLAKNRAKIIEMDRKMPKSKNPKPLARVVE